MSEAKHTYFSAERLISNILHSASGYEQKSAI